jgi:hypothetical protein
MGVVCCGLGVDATEWYLILNGCCDIARLGGPGWRETYIHMDIYRDFAWIVRIYPKEMACFRLSSQESRDSFINHITVVESYSIYIST